MLFLSRSAASWLLVYIALSSTSLTACTEEKVAARPPQMVRAVKVERIEHASSVTLTGEIQPQLESVMAFRVGGCVAARVVDVGDRVVAGDLLASLDPAELQTTVTATAAAVDAARAQHKRAASTFERQQALLASGFTTRRVYDQAEEAIKSASAALDGAEADLAAAREQLANAELRATISGIVTVRKIEAGQVVQAAQPAFTIAADGGRDAVFEVNESIFERDPRSRTITVALVADPEVIATGTVREVSPALNGTGTVTVKVGLSDVPEAMELGAAVSGIATFRSAEAMALPWQALTAGAGGAAVWVADRATGTVSLRSVRVQRYDAGEVLLAAGLQPGEPVVTAGAQLLRPGQQIEIAEESKP
jgi:RND family efflux transporter MFP subunit